MIRLFALSASLLALISCGSNEPNATGGSVLFGLGPTPGMPVTYHPSEAIYTIDLLVDGERFPNVLIDTGSANLTVFGDSTLCANCVTGSGITTFQPATLTPSSPPLYNGQTFNIKFGVGSGTVRNYTAQIGFAHFGDPIEYPLGVYTSGNHLDNVLGLGYQANIVGLSGATPAPFLDEFVKKNNLQNLFTLNFCASGDGSFMTIGTIPSQISRESIHYTPIIKNSLKSTPQFDFYAVDPIAIWPSASSGAFPFPDQAQGFLTIVDSGTSLLYLPKQVIAELARAYLQKGIPATFWDIYAADATTLTEAQFGVLENIELEFPSVSGASFKVKLRPETYTIRSGTVEKPVYYSAISKAFNLNSDGSKQLVILGEVFLQNNYAVFDRTENRLGLTSNDVMCPRP